MSSTPLHHTGLGRDPLARIPAATPTSSPTPTPSPSSRSEYAAITGGRKVAALTAVGLVGVVVVGLLPIVGSLVR